MRSFTREATIGRLLHKEEAALKLPRYIWKMLLTQNILECLLIQNLYYGW